MRSAQQPAAPVQQTVAPPPMVATPDPRLNWFNPNAMMFNQPLPWMFPPSAGNFDPRFPTNDPRLMQNFGLQDPRLLQSFLPPPPQSDWTEMILIFQDGSFQRTIRDRRLMVKHNLSNMNSFSGNNVSNLRRVWRLFLTDARQIRWMLRADQL